MCENNTFNYYIQEKKLRGSSWFILGDPGAPNRKDAIFSGKSLLQARKSALPRLKQTLFRPKIPLAQKYRHRRD